MHHTIDIFPPREISPKEREILDFLLAEAFDGREEIRFQLDKAKVSGKCACGCPSIVFSVDRDAVPAASVRSRVPTEAVAVEKDGTKIAILLHVVEGYVSELEVYRHDGGTIKVLPNRESLRRLRWNGTVAHLE